MEAGQDVSPSAQEVSEAAVSEAQIAVHWREEEYYHPPARFIGQANASDLAIREPAAFKALVDQAQAALKG